MFKRENVIITTILLFITGICFIFFGDTKTVSNIGITLLLIGLFGFVFIVSTPGNEKKTYKTPTLKVETTFKIEAFNTGETDFVLYATLAIPSVAFEHEPTHDDYTELIKKATGKTWEEINRD